MRKIKKVLKNVENIAYEAGPNNKKQTFFNIGEKTSASVFGRYFSNIGIGFLSHRRISTAA